MGKREIWRVIPSLPTHKASSWGRIRSIPFEGTMPHGGVRVYGGKATFGIWHHDTKRFGFAYKGKNYKVARLVCEAFHGPSPFKGARTLHKDENSKNNIPSNLKWGTQKENLNAPGFIAYCKSRVGENNPHVKGRLRKSMKSTCPPPPRTSSTVAAGRVVR